MPNQLFCCPSCKGTNLLDPIDWEALLPLPEAEVEAEVYKVTRFLKFTCDSCLTIFSIHTNR